MEEFTMAYIEFKNVDKEYKMGEVTIKALDNTNFELEYSQNQKQYQNMR